MKFWPAIASVLFCLAACGPSPDAARGELRVNLATEPPTLDWSLATDGTSIKVIEQLMRGLTRLGPDLLPQPALAERWDVSPDGLTYTFHLRPGVVWSDGVPLRAQDFVFSWRRLMDPATAAEYAYFLFPVKNARAVNSGELEPEQLGVRALDDATLQVRLEAPLVYFSSLVNFMVTFPQRRDVIERWGDGWTEAGRLISLGPFILEEWRHEYRIVLRANADFYAGRPELDRVIGYMVEEAATALVLFEQGILDLVDLPPLEIRRYRSHPAYRRKAQLRGYYYGFNTRKPPFDDVRVRRAFAMAIDRSQFPPLLQGGEIAWSSWIPPGMPHNNPEIGLGFDPEGARRLLAEAGVDPAELKPIQVVYNSNETHKLVAEKVQAMWRKHLGVDVVLANREWKVFLKEVQVDTPMVYRLGWGADFADPDNFINLFTSDSANNYTGWGNPRYDQLTEQAARERDPSLRQKLYDEAQRILCEQDVPIVPFFVTSINSVVAERVKGFEINPMDLWFLEEVSTR
ncbi:MAG: peptide ABC transporter substrate-binding protein [bacterium]|nr:peptide ABC transporter substrate-binding protein [bacterium]